MNQYLCFFVYFCLARNEGKGFELCPPIIVCRKNYLGDIGIALDCTFTGFSILGTVGRSTALLRLVFSCLNTFYDYCGSSSGLRICS